MTQVITAPEPIDANGFCVFLAGAIDMGAAVNWQSEVITRLNNVYGLNIFNPRRENFSPDTLDEQIRWELTALEMADIVLMWLPSNSKAPISFFEAGLYWKSGKLLIGAGTDFYRRRNLEITGERYGVHIYQSLDELINELLSKYDEI